MKKLLYIFTILFAFCFVKKADAQSTTDSSATYIIVKQNGTELIGKIISQNPYEVLLETKTIGQVAIPKSDIKEIRLLRKDEIKSGGEYNPDQPFATRYFLTTNGHPIKKGDMYAQWNLYGPEIQFGLTENFGMGLMTTWYACPIVLSAKYSTKLGDDFSLGLGTLLGTGSWAFPSFYMALPFGALTYGDRRSNITLSAGYGAVGYRKDIQTWDPNTYSYATSSIYNREGRALLSIAGMLNVNRKVSLVFDSFIVPATNSDQDAFALFIPGLRFQTDPNKAFQFGFAGIRVSTVSNNQGTKVRTAENVPVPIPMMTWFRRL